MQTAKGASACDRCPEPARHNSMDCEGNATQFCLRCYIAHCHAHARCRNCFGPSGFNNTFRDRMAKKTAGQTLRSLEARVAGLPSRRTTEEVPA